MRFSVISLLSVAATLATFVNAYGDDFHYEAREYVDELSTRDLDRINDMLERRDVLSDFTTRDLMDELSERLERRQGNKQSKPKHPCPYCGTLYVTEQEAKDCAQPQILGGCKVNGAVQQVQGRKSPSPPPSPKKASPPLKKAGKK